jgi:hypothetical protein
MSEGKVLGVVPSGEAFNSLSPHQRKALVEQHLRAALDEFDADNREPDRWEAERLSYAIGCLSSQMYYAAANALDRAREPSEARTDQESWARVEDTATTRILRQALERAVSDAASAS